MGVVIAVSIRAGLLLIFALAVLRLVRRCFGAYQEGKNER